MPAEKLTGMASVINLLPQQLFKQKHGNNLRKIFKFD